MARGHALCWTSGVFACLAAGAVLAAASQATTPSQDLPPGVKPIVQFDKTRFASNERVFFWVGVTAPGDFVFPRAMQVPGRLRITWPDGTERVTESPWPSDGMTDRGWRGGAGLGSERPQIGRYSVSFEFQGLKSPPASFTVEDVPILKDIHSEFVFPASPILGPDSGATASLVVGNRSSQTIRFPHRTGMDGVWVHLDKTSGTRWGSQFFVPEDLLLAAARIPKPNLMFDVFRWDAVGKIPTVELAPGTEYRLSLPLGFLVAPRGPIGPPPPGDYDLTFGTSLMVLIGEATGPWAELCPLHVGVESMAQVRVTSTQPTTVRSQARPDFSGVWTFVPPPAAEAAKASFLRTWTGDPVTIRQDATTISVEYVSNSRAHAPVKLIYNLDGSERTNTDPNSGAGFSQERLTRAEWRGATLALVTTAPRMTNGQPDPIVITEVLSLDSPTSMSVQIERKSRTLTDAASAIYRRK